MANASVFLLNFRTNYVIFINYSVYINITATFSINTHVSIESNSDLLFIIVYFNMPGGQKRKSLFFKPILLPLFASEGIDNGMGM